MAVKPRRFDTTTPLETLDTYESLEKKSKDLPNKLFVALFNTEFSEGRTIESKLKSWRNHYETKFDTKFYKYIVTKADQKIKIDFNIEDTPTLIFFRNGTVLKRIDDFDEANLTIPHGKSNEGDETKDEQRAKELLDQLSTPVSS